MLPLEKRNSVSLILKDVAFARVLACLMIKVWKTWTETLLKFGQTLDTRHQNIGTRSGTAHAAPKYVQFVFIGIKMFIVVCPLKHRLLYSLPLKYIIKIDRFSVKDPWLRRPGRPLVRILIR